MVLGILCVKWVKHDRYLREIDVLSMEKKVSHSRDLIGGFGMWGWRNSVEEVGNSVSVVSQASQASQPSRYLEEVG